MPLPLRPIRMMFAAFAPLLLAGCLQRVVWMPDGKRLAYVRDGVIWIADLDGMQRRLAAAPAPLDPELAAGPGGLVAATGRLAAGEFRLVVLDSAGGTRFEAGLPAEAPHALLEAGCWSPNGRFLAVRMGQSVYLADLQSGQGKTVTDAGAAARFTGTGDLVALKDAAGSWTAHVSEGTGKPLGTRPWKTPQGLASAVPVSLADDASAAWWRGRKGAREAMAFAGPDGRVVASADRAAVSAGPDGRSYVTDAGGYAVIRAGAAPVNLNVLYNRLLRMDLNWHLADPASAAEAYDPAAMLKSCAPSFSPDGARIAILTPRLLAVGTLATGEVTALAKW